MSRVELSYTLDEARAVLTLEMAVDGDPKAHMFLDSVDLDGLIANLAQQRATMHTEVPRELDPISRALVVQDPVWRQINIRGESGIGLALRHPGLGWIQFLFPEHEALAISKFLHPHREQK